MEVQKKQNRFGGTEFPTWGDLGIIIAAFVVASLLVGVCTFVLNLFSISLPLLNFIAYILTMGLLLGFIIIYRKNRKAPRISFRAPYRKMSPLLLLWGVVLMVIASTIIEPLLDLMPEWGMTLVKNTVGRGGWAIATVVIAAPIFEELIFRGYILNSIKAKMGVIPAIVLSAAIFGIIHFIPQQVVNGFLMGLILGYIYVRTGSLWVVMLMHAINNGVAYLQMQLGAESLREMIPNNTLYWIIYVVFVVIAVIATYMIIKTLKKIDEENSENSHTIVPTTDGND